MCGPKTAACCTVLSTWGLIQLGITGVFMYLGSPALVEDIPLAENRCSACETKVFFVVTKQWCFVYNVLAYITIFNSHSIEEFEKAAQNKHFILHYNHEIRPQILYQFIM